MPRRARARPRSAPRARPAAAPRGGAPQRPRTARAELCERRRRARGRAPRAAARPRRAGIEAAAPPRSAPRSGRGRPRSARGPTRSPARASRSLGAERLAELRDVGLDDLARARRRRSPHSSSTSTSAATTRPRVEQQPGEQRARLAGRERDAVAVARAPRAARAGGYSVTRRSSQRGACAGDTGSATAARRGRDGGRPPRLDGEREVAVKLLRPEQARDPSGATASAARPASPRRIAVAATSSRCSSGRGGGTALSRAAALSRPRSRGSSTRGPLEPARADRAGHGRRRRGSTRCTRVDSCTAT